jgi:TIR domain-containing protein
VPVAASHLFICFSSRDEATAREVVEVLEANGLACWISLRNVSAGQNYQEAIVQAIEAAQGIVFLFSESSSQSGEIKKELSIGASLNLPVFPVRLSSVLPSGALRYELAIRQWIDIFPDRRDALGRLAETIKKAIAAPPTRANTTPATAPLALDAAIRTATPEAVPGHVAPANFAPSLVPIVTAGTPEFEAIRALLAGYVGPIAKVLVAKTANEARTADEFCERLATHVAAPLDRASFLRAVRARLTVKP